MRTDDTHGMVAGASIEARLSRIETVVSALTACLGLDLDTLAEHGEAGIEDSAVERVEAMLLDLAEAVRFQAMWVREGEHAGFFPARQSVRARLQMEAADLRGQVTQVEQSLHGGPHPDLRAALEQRATTCRERLRGVNAKLALLQYPAREK